MANHTEDLQGQLDFTKKKLAALWNLIPDDGSEEAIIVEELKEKTDEALESVKLLQEEIEVLRQQPKEEIVAGYGVIHYSAPNLMDGQVMEALGKCLASGRVQETLQTLEFLANG